MSRGHESGCFVGGERRQTVCLILPVRLGTSMDDARMIGLSTGVSKVLNWVVHQFQILL